MKKVFVLIIVLAMVAGILFALEIGGSTEASGIGNGEEQIIFVDQEIDIDLDALHFDVDGGIDYVLPVENWLWDYEIGAAYTVSVFTFGGTIAGNKDLNLDVVTAYADIVAGEVGVDVDFEFSADVTKDAFQGADFSAFFNPGPFEIRVGYLLTENALPDVNAPELLEKGGIYGKIKFSY